jgi:hypothetical protein
MTDRKQCGDLSTAHRLGRDDSLRGVDSRGANAGNSPLRFASVEMTVCVVCILAGANAGISPLRFARVEMTVCGVWILAGANAGISPLRFARVEMTVCGVTGVGGLPLFGLRQA